MAGNLLCRSSVVTAFTGTFFPFRDFFYCMIVVQGTMLFLLWFCFVFENCTHVQF